MSNITFLKISKWLKIIAMLILAVTILYIKTISFLLAFTLVIGVIFLIELWQIYLLKNTKNYKSFKVYFQNAKQSTWSVILFSLLLIIIGFFNQNQIKVISIGQIYFGFISLFNLRYKTNWTLIFEDNSIHTNNFSYKQIPLSSISKMKITADKELLIYYGDNKNIIPTLNEEDSLDLMNRILEKYPVEIIEN